MKQEYIEMILKDIQEAEMVLVGIGEEFDGGKLLKTLAGYEMGKNLINQSEQSSLTPLWQKIYREKSGIDETIKAGLDNLCHSLENKNYFVVSVSTNDILRQIPWKNNYVVMPCGSNIKWQCKEECEQNLTEVDEAFLDSLQKKLVELETQLSKENITQLTDYLGTCPCCGGKRSFNNVYAKSYMEQGYLDDWNRYTKWLQGTLNRKLLVLELGVGMRFPSVIRFPFEKIVFFNQKAKLYRINENLYQLTEELAEKGVGIANNAIDCLKNLC